MATDHRPAVSRRQLLILSGGFMGAMGVAACSSDDEAPDAFGNGGGTDLMESPMLTERVEAGELPELGERLPENPMVVEPWSEPGRFGGILNRATTGDDSQVTHWIFSHAGLLEWNWEADGPMLSLAAEYENDDTNTRFTFTLREGLKWSDGEPFTTEDIEFVFEGVLGNDALWPIPPAWLTNRDGSLVGLDVEDDLTFSIIYEEPYSLFERGMCFPRYGLELIRPKHYLTQFHPEYTSESEVEEIVSEEGYQAWEDLFHDRSKAWFNEEVPVMGAYWGTGDLDSQGSGLMDRNPYYWKTDPDGRQLPYIDQVQIQGLEQDALDLRAANGDMEFQGYQVGYNSSQVFIQNAEENGYQVHRWALEEGLITLYPNLSHQNESLREVFAERDFRIALSIAIDRDDMNSTLLGGLGESRQPLPTEGSDYHIEGADQKHLEYDVDEANRLLDELGLERGSDGIRMTPDGTPLSLVVISQPTDAGIPMSDVLARVGTYWEEIGIDLTHQQLAPSLYFETWTSNDYDIDASEFHQTGSWDLEPVWYVPVSSRSHSMSGYGLWYETGGSEGMEPPDEVMELLGHWEDLIGAPTDEDRIDAGRRIVEHHDDHLYVIGVIARTFHPVIANNDVGNIRDDEPVLANFYGHEGIAKPEQIYFTDGD